MVNNKVSFELNGNHSSLFASTHDLFVGQSLCFNGVIDQSDKIARVRPFRIKLVSSEHIHKIEQSSRRGIQTVQAVEKYEEILPSPVVDMKRPFNYAFGTKFPRCLSILIPPPQIIRTINMFQMHYSPFCYYSWLPKQYVTLLVSAPVVTHRFAVEVSTIDDNGSILRQRFPLLPQDSSTIGLIGIDSTHVTYSNFNDLLYGQTLIFDNTGNRLCFAPEGCNKPYEAVGSRPFGYIFDRDREVMWTQMEEHSKTAGYQVPLNKREELITYDAPQYKNGIEYKEGQLLIGKDYIDGMLTLRIKTQLPIYELIIKQGVVTDFECSVVSQSINCIVKNCTYSGFSTMLLFFGKSDSDLDLIDQKDDKVMALIGSRFSFALPLTDIYEEILTAYVCTKFGRCQEIKFAIAKPIIFPEVPPKEKTPANTNDDITKNISLPTPGDIIKIIKDKTVWIVALGSLLLIMVLGILLRCFRCCRTPKK